MKRPGLHGVAKLKKRNKISKERAASPSNFFNRALGHGLRALSAGHTRFTEEDAALLRGLGSLPERGFRVIRAVARRCPHGFPQVLCCSPLMRGLPFPTAYWLVCPHLMRTIGGIEGENGVAYAQDAMRGDAYALYAYHRLHALIRLGMLRGAQKIFLRRYRKSLYRALARGGVGGIAYRFGEIHAKCVHLHAASYLALGFHPAARFLEERIGAWFCREGSCFSNTKEEAVQ